MPSDEKSVNKDHLTPSQRVGELFSVQLLMLFLAFMLYHQLADTGFYTEDFRSVEKLCLYGPMLLAFLPPIIRAVGGGRNRARPYEAATNLSQALGSLWLVSIFPFEYAHLADALPKFLRFSLEWVTNDMARIVFIIMIVVGVIAFLVNTIRYLIYPRPPESVLL